ncbi:MAG: hypothetical protein H0W05_01520 [Thermoleophilaceae bacterium]|nr:hypothetical protein [Thermoleophilaceae bacterium]
MRLNFSGVGEEAIREGVRRIGAVVDEQVALYGTLTGRSSGTDRRSQAAREHEDRRPSAREEAPGPGGETSSARDDAGGRVVELPRRSAREA